MRRLLDDGASYREGLWTGAAIVILAGVIAWFCWLVSRGIR